MDKEKSQVSQSLNGPSEVSNQTEESKPQPDTYNPFTPALLKLSPDILTKVSETLITVSVGRPPEQQFVQVCPDENFHFLAALLSVEAEKGKKYLLMPQVLPRLDVKFNYEWLYLTVTMQKALSFWPIKAGRNQEQLDNSWLISQMKAVQMAQTEWITVCTDLPTRSYKVREAASKFPDPDWKQLVGGKDVYGLLALAFQNRLIDTEDHAVIQKLRGVI